ncbi:MAG: divalent metal cation transporter [Bacteroidota bacterium]
MKSILRLFRAIGPGLLFASMAIGTSHLVLSTKAGAQYGWIMVIPIVLANVFKYPFFEFGIRFTTVTRKSLIQGYSDLGKGYLWTYAVVTLISTFSILAALYVVTAGLLVNLFDITSISLELCTLALFACISGILIIGKYKVLEKSLKVIISLLFVALLTTTLLVLAKGPVVADVPTDHESIFTGAGILFLISLMGWMPTAVEASGWVSLWAIENQKKEDTPIPLKKALQEFNLGYFLTAILAIFFMIIGWYTLYGTGTELSGKAVLFADQLVTLFTTHIGAWSYFLIAIAAFATMFSTCMTAHDALARVSVDVLQKMYPQQEKFKGTKAFAVGIIALAIMNLTVVLLFQANMEDLVGLATFIAFVLGPILGWMNLKTVTGADIPKESQPKLWLRLLTYSGILFLSLFAAYYVYVLLR